jgi:hypothetical protein
MWNRLWKEFGWETEALSGNPLHCPLVHHKPRITRFWMKRGHRIRTPVTNPVSHGSAVLVLYKKNQL